MKTKGKHKTVSQIARRGSALLCLLATAVISVRVAHAQSTASSVPAPHSKPSAVAAKTTDRALPTVNPGRAGIKTGVKVHGYWKIDVKNPDGNLASHTEFENSLTTNDPYGLSGDDALTLLLNGGSSSVVTTAGPAVGASAIVAALQAVTKSKSDTVGEVILEIPYLVAYVNTNGLNYVAGQPIQAINYVLPGPCGSSPCLTPTSQSANGNTLSLATSFVASAQSTINEVGTFVSFLSVKFAGKLSDFQYTVTQPGYANYTFTSANLGPPGSCGGQSQPACQVSVSPGQTIAVSVLLSFD